MGALSTKRQGRSVAEQFPRFPLSADEKQETDDTGNRPRKSDRPEISQHSHVHYLNEKDTQSNFTHHSIQNSNHEVHGGISASDNHGLERAGHRGPDEMEDQNMHEGDAQRQYFRVFGENPEDFPRHSQGQQTEYCCNTQGAEKCIPYCFRSPVLFLCPQILSHHSAGRLGNARRKQDRKSTRLNSSHD